MMLLKTVTTKIFVALATCTALPNATGVTTGAGEQP